MADLLIADVNNYRRVADWSAYRAWSPVVIAKMTQGVEYLAPTFAPHRDGARDAGLRGFGAYHFWQPGVPAAAQARNAVRALGRLRDDPLEWLVLDVEGGTEWAHYEEFCRLADDALGRVTWLYGGRQLAQMPAFSAHRPQWVARYYDYTPGTRGQPGIGEVLWQFSDRYPVPGVAGGPADCNVYRGTADGLLRFIGGGRMATLDADDLKAIGDLLENRMKRVLNTLSAAGTRTFADTVENMYARTGQTLAAVNAVNERTAQMQEALARHHATGQDGPASYPSAAEIAAATVAQITTLRFTTDGR